jgi:SNF2 family DNA or RNA helicase
MGLGKTVQVLALLDAHRQGRSIIVVPRSLIFNWMREANRFAPELKVLDFSGPRRRIEEIESSGADVVLTTYGTLRSDIAELTAIRFEYAILDEAQAIKNPATGSAKAARLLRARHKLALSGTPVENRLKELWSLFEFLNPGMLGPASTFAMMAELADPPADDTLRRALRPVILRRTKQQVAPELPERTEQTWYVDLDPAQRVFYLELLARTRRSVFDEIDRSGMNRARMHIREALLRLRQAACAPVLADPTRPRLPSAKLDALVPTLAEIVDEGHKAVVFSQFTRFLALVRARLDDAGLAYEYLDGSTRHRDQHVDRFQSADGPPLFLVSLKAGGHGLNLTAADYVYLLDPWWNPAVEAQAIDRAHRIGQTRHVIATRLVARGTIEEKLLELQASKRALADAILGADQGMLASIGRDELEMLLAVG